jgi:hypothetical protein
MKITVTQEDIQAGQRRDPEQCAVALALFRAGLDHCGVMGPSVTVSDAFGRLICLPLPVAVSDWIFDFDAGKAVGPITFEMDFVQKRPRSPTLRERQTRASQPFSVSARQDLTLLSPHDLKSVDRIRSSARCKRPVLTGRRSGSSLKNGAQ